MSIAKRSRERGAVALEFAIVIPLLALLAFGAIEMGSAWDDSQTVLTSTRTAARSLAQFGDDPQADRDAMLSIEASYANSPAAVTAVIIYESDDAVNGGAAPDACMTAAVSATAYTGPENCNVYTATDYATAIGAGGAASFGCAPGALDANWCPTTRVRTQADATFIGVHVIAARTSVTGFERIPVPTTLDQFSVMRLEPFPT